MQVTSTELECLVMRFEFKSVYLTRCPDSLFVTVLFIWDVTGLRGFA